MEITTQIDSGSDMESVIEYEDGPKYIKDWESQISDHYDGPNKEEAVTVDMNSKKLKEQLKQWIKINEFMNEERKFLIGIKSKSHFYLIVRIKENL